MPGRLPFVSRSRKLLRIPYPAADPARVESCRGSGCLRFNLYGSIRAKLPPARKRRPESFRKGSLKNRSGSGLDADALKPALQTEGNGAAGGGGGHVGHRVEVVAVGKVGDAEIDADLFA